VRGVIVVPNRGVPPNVRTHDAWISFINHDGSVHTARWVGVQPPAERADLTPPLVLNEPLGSDIANGTLYVADRDGGTGANGPSVAVIRRFDMRTGAPAGEIRVSGSAWFNDIEVADDGTVYATQTGDRGDNPDPATWQVWRITPDGAASILVQGAPLYQPNGIAIDPQGNVVVVNVGDPGVLTFSPAGALVKTEHAAQDGSDGLVIMPDGTKYVSIVLRGGVSRLRPRGAGRAHRPQHPERRVDVLRRRREPREAPVQLRAGVTARAASVATASGSAPRTRHPVPAGAPPGWLPSPPGSPCDSRARPGRR